MTPPHIPTPNFSSVPKYSCSLQATAGLDHDRTTNGNMASDGSHKMPQPSGPINGVYNVYEKLPSGEDLLFLSESLFLTEDQGSIWSYFEFNQIKGMFRVRSLRP